MPGNPVDLEALEKVVVSAKKIAIKFREITGKPLGITGEVGEFIAADLLKLKLTDARNPGYDAIARNGRKNQIKSRVVLPGSSLGQRLGSIKLDHDWDSVILVLMDINFEPLELWEAARADIERELKKPGSKSRNERGALGIRKFKSIAKPVWLKKEVS